MCERKENITNMEGNTRPGKLETLLNIDRTVRAGIQLVLQIRRSDIFQLILSNAPRTNYPDFCDLLFRTIVVLLQR
jgi:hypothetical protein